MPKAVPLLALLAAALVGCSSAEQAEGYDAASKRAAENLAKNGNDISKLSAEDKAALEKAAQGYPGGGGASSPGPGGAAGAPPRRDSGMPQGYGQARSGG